MTATGMSIKDTAKELSLSIKTVSTYRTRIMTKLKIKNVAELVHFAMEHDIL
jgi:DNA-binding CsgD family transcriptional regulator